MCGHSFEKEIISDLKHHEEASDVHAGCFGKTDRREIEKGAVHAEQSGCSRQEGQPTRHHMIMKAHPHDDIAERLADCRREDKQEDFHTKNVGTPSRDVQFISDAKLPKVPVELGCV